LLLQIAEKTTPIVEVRPKVLGALHMFSSFWLLRVESCVFFQAEKKNAFKAEQIHKMTTIFIQKDNLGHVEQLDF
jgi:hypothetical protein